MTYEQVAFLVAGKIRVRREGIRRVRSLFILDFSRRAILPIVRWALGEIGARLFGIFVGERWIESRYWIFFKRLVRLFTSIPSLSHDFSRYFEFLFRIISYFIRLYVWKFLFVFLFVPCSCKVYVWKFDFIVAPASNLHISLHRNNALIHLLR